MSIEVLEDLLDYLRSTLDVDNRRWLAQHLMEPDIKRYTIDELHERIDMAKDDIANGRVYSEAEMEKIIRES